jgi:hypothetical protein
MNLLDQITLVCVVNGSLSLIISMITQANSAGSESTFFKIAKDELKMHQRVEMDVVMSDLDEENMYLVQNLHS